MTVKAFCFAIRKRYKTNNIHLIFVDTIESD